MKYLLVLKMLQLVNFHINDFKDESENMIVKLGRIGLNSSYVHEKYQLTMEVHVENVFLGEINTGTWPSRLGESLN
jgi:hypothetical protein